MRLVVTGRSGQVVRALAERAAALEVEVMAIGRPEFDLQDAGGAEAILRALQPDAVVSAAAYTAVDKAETDAVTAQQVNAIGPGHLARATEALGVPLVHLSTDYVFDGTKPGPYEETDAPNPLGVYGRTKLAGEQAVAAGTANHAILRTSWVYSPFGNNFLKTMLRLAAERPQLRVVDDQRGGPTSALDIAGAIVTVARNLVANPDDADRRGIFHLSGAGAASWADFAEEIFATAKALGGPAADVVRIGTAEYPTPARRPANSLLATGKLARQHGVSLPDWRSSTREVVRRLVT